jgi:prepilin-type N-terminal cleavage/methylation domain-containing protein
MTGRRFPRGAARRAFSLVELTIVLLLLAILAAVAAPKYQAALASYRVRLAAGRVAADLRMIRQFARKASTPQTVVFDAAANSYAAPALPDRDGRAAAYAVSLWSSEYATDVVSASFGGSPSVTFDIYGRPSAAGSVVLQAGALPKSVQLDEAGNVSIF